MEILDVINRYNCVKAIFSGHHHSGAFGYFDHIPCNTVEGMIETPDKNSFGIVRIYKDRIELEGKDLKVIWQVENPDTKTLYFSIVGHPAFMCPVDGKGKQSEYYFKFDTDKDLTYGLVADDGQGLM